ncbi:hypothetical protein ES332_A11G217200v1 [Gossypium tomentosum]|uniref:Uncharacterized protein n=1 Tax=Gossypium tomentosum TaxID=34277 RepID=A0A5D2NCY7_GOSTO|nr:hypothetical protein ES332_A11G217200v1 [Gossypium tomentosum]
MVDGARAETRSCQQRSPMEIYRNSKEKKHSTLAPNLYIFEICGRSLVSIQVFSFFHEERGEACVKEAVRGTTRGSPTLWHYSSIF